MANPMLVDLIMQFLLAFILLLPRASQNQANIQSIGQSQLMSLAGANPQAQDPPPSSSVLLSNDLQRARGLLIRDEPQSSAQFSGRSSNGEQVNILSQPGDFSGGYSVLGVGWPATSPVWPTIERAGAAAAGGADSKQQASNGTKATNLTDPFIYTDKRSDYNLFLNPAKKVRETLRNAHTKLEAQISFTYYFNYGSKVTKMPSIKIDLDGQQIEHLEPNLNSTQSQSSSSATSASQTGTTTTSKTASQARVWLTFSKSIQVTDSSNIDAEDWLKISLNVREQPSLVALRRLKVELIPQSRSPAPPSTSKPTTASVTPSPPPTRGGGGGGIRGNQHNTFTEDEELETSTSSSGIANKPPVNIQSLTTKEPAGFVSSWITGRGRKKRLAGGGVSELETAAIMDSNSPAAEILQPIVFACYQASACLDWRGPSAEEPILWSLARMPPSTDTVKNGYFYVSNRDNYGDSTKLLRLSLNETEQGTVAGQRSDHCIRVALYVTEMARINLYKMLLADSQQQTAANNQQPPGSQPHWRKGNLLLSWSTTLSGGVSSRPRIGVSSSRLAAIDNGQMGWTYERLCFGDFFLNVRECSLGKCALAFEMELQNGVKQPAVDASEPGAAELIDVNQLAAGGNADASHEQVVGVALLSQFTELAPIRDQKRRWLESWSRPEVKPSDAWRFFPSQDVSVAWRNTSLVNLLDESQYHFHSDWLELSANMSFLGRLQILQGPRSGNETADNSNSSERADLESSFITRPEPSPILAVEMVTRFVDQNFAILYTTNSTQFWSASEYLTSHELNFPVSSQISKSSQSSQVSNNDPLTSSDMMLIKIIFDFSLKYLDSSSRLISEELERIGPITLSLSDFSLSDRCFPNPCNFGQCSQLGTGPDELTCKCQDDYRGARCELGNWCQVAHVSPWQPPSQLVPQQKNLIKPITIKPPASNQNNQSRKPRLEANPIRLSGRDYCKQKLGPNAKCTDFDLPLNRDHYEAEGSTFSCSCQDGFYLNDEFKCKQAHLCNSIVCPGPGSFCDESRPFNSTQPCQCDQSQGWHPDELEPATSGKCIRRQCMNKIQDCQFDAHVCLPTLSGEKPICKCDPLFTLMTDKDGNKACQSIACNLPSLNHCHQICVPNNQDRVRPYTCACHPGFTLNPDGISCSHDKAKPTQHCKPACNTQSQICTRFGCKCKQGYTVDNEITSQVTIDGVEASYTQSIRCVNQCSTGFAEAKQASVQAACPYGLCDPSHFGCKCSLEGDISPLLINKYEQDAQNSTAIASHHHNGSKDLINSYSPRAGALCRLKRVCEPGSASYKICQSQGAFCVPDYSKSSLFDCLCPPSTEKHQTSSSGLVSDFTCEPKCNSSKSDCLRRMAVCKLYEKNQAKCECMPGFIESSQDSKCYLAKYSYSFSMQLVNKYYEPKSRFYSQIRNADNVTSSELLNAFRLSRLNMAQPISLQTAKSGNSNSLSATIIEGDNIPSDSITAGDSSSLFKNVFNPSFNQCNISQILPQTILEDRFDHDLISLLGFMDQCNQKLNEDMRTHYLYHRVSEDIKKTLKQHLTDFSVITKEASCFESEETAKHLNCTIYLQSMQEPVDRETLDAIFSQCDKPGVGDEFCWIKPRILVKKPKLIGPTTNGGDVTQEKSFANFKQIIPCEMKGFCDSNSHSVRLDNTTSLCSCKCNPGIEVEDAKQLEERENEDPNKIAVKESCVPKDHCNNPVDFCLSKPGSKCFYDRRQGSKCICEYPSYEHEGMCKQTTSTTQSSAVSVIVIILILALAISILINIWAASRARSGCTKTKQYQLNEFPTSPTFRRPPGNNRSTGVPNPAFSDEE